LKDLAKLTFYEKLNLVTSKNVSNVSLKVVTKVSKEE
jgi:hypothetical protein